MYSLLKAVHIIGFVSWFSGLFYIGRLFIYLRELESRSDSERLVLSKQFNLMASRVNKVIIHPAMGVTVLAGLGLAHVSGAFSQAWFHLKFTMILLLIAYTIVCSALRKRFSKQDFGAWNSLKLRYFNELATLFLVVIVLMAVFRDGFITRNVLIGLSLFTSLIVLGVWRSKKSK